MSRPGETSSLLAGRPLAGRPLAGRPLAVVVDDDTRLQQSLKGLLRSAGIEARVFSSGAAALASSALAEAACLITDIRMPEMDGWELQRRAAALYPTLPLIFITAHQDEAASRRACSTGAVAFFYKPFDGEELLRVVEYATQAGGAPGQLPPARLVKRNR